MSTKIDTKQTLYVVRKMPVRRRALAHAQIAQFVAQVAEMAPATTSPRALAGAVAVALEQYEGEPLTLGDGLIDALLGSRGATECTGAEKLRRWKLGKLIEEAMEATDSTLVIATGDIDFLTECAAAHYPAAVYGAIYDCLHSAATAGG